MNIRPPLNKLAGKIYPILYDVENRVMQKHELEKLFTFKNVILHKIYKVELFIKLKLQTYECAKKGPQIL
jgi:hypothetical protein